MTIFHTHYPTPAEAEQLLPVPGQVVRTVPSRHQPYLTPRSSWQVRRDAGPAQHSSLPPRWFTPTPPPALPHPHRRHEGGGEEEETKKRICRLQHSFIHPFILLFAFSFITIPTGTLFLVSIVIFFEEYFKFMNFNTSSTRLRCLFLLATIHSFTHPLFLLFAISFISIPTRTLFLRVPLNILPRIF